MSLVYRTSYILISIGTNGFRNNVSVSEKKGLLVDYLKRKNFRFNEKFGRYVCKHDKSIEYEISKIQNIIEIKN